MKIVGHVLGRVIVLFDPEELRPTRGMPISDVFAAIKTRYNFSRAPNLSEPPAKFEQEGYKFEIGSFEYDGEKSSIQEFTIFNDGISASAFDTTYAETFIKDVLAWAHQSYGLRTFERPPIWVYRSTITVEFEAPLSNLVKKLDSLASVIQQSFSDSTGYDKPVNMTRIDFGLDQTQIAGAIKPSSFIIERRINSPHNQERYYSEAPLSSKAHIELLEQIETQFLNS